MKGGTGYPSLRCDTNARPHISRLSFVFTVVCPFSSGRTGRAGRKGVCVTLFSPKYRAALSDIENAVGNKFEWLGAPQPADIVGAAAEALMEVGGTYDCCCPSSLPKPCADSLLSRCVVLSLLHTGCGRCG